MVSFHSHAYDGGGGVRKSGIDGASLRRQAAASPAYDSPGPLLQLKRKPDGSSIGILIAAIQNELVKGPSLSVGRGASVDPQSSDTEVMHRAAYTPPEPQEAARNETSFAKTRPGQVQNVSIHYKTLRVAEVMPLDAVSPEGPPAEGNIAVQPRTADLKTGGVMQAQRVSATVEDDVQPQKLAVVPRFGKADNEAGTALPSLAALQREAGLAIYDIEGGMVYLPNGETLEAHSGMGQMRDNPVFVNRRNRGPTPPHIYDLKLRERPFHGVQAIRLMPVEGEASVFGRDGFLAHTYMLRRRGDSNGCVVFKDYSRFLAAFKKGEIKRMVVVPRLKEAPASILAASLPAKNG